MKRFISGSIRCRMVRALVRESRTKEFDE